MKEIFKAMIIRITGSPITTMVGVVLIGIGVMVYLQDKHEPGMLMIGAGSTLLLNKD